MSECLCLERGPKRPDVVDVRNVGCDPTEGRFADVTVVRCARCRRLWLRYKFEIEAFTASGRWYEAPIDQNAAETITPEAADAFIQAAPWHVFGGSYYGHAGRRAAAKQ